MATKRKPKETTEQVKLRRAPKFGPFVITGGAFGGLLGLLLWIVIATSSKGDASIGGYIFVFMGAMGMAGGVFLAVVFDWLSHKATQEVKATKIEK